MMFEPDQIEAIIEIDIPQDSDFFSHSARAIASQKLPFKLLAERL